MRFSWRWRNFRVDNLTAYQSSGLDQQFPHGRVQSATLRKVRLAATASAKALRQSTDDVVARDRHVGRTSGDDHTGKRLREQHDEESRLLDNGQGERLELSGIGIE